MADTSRTARGRRVGDLDDAVRRDSDGEIAGRQKSSGEAELRTFLIADIRGYTKFTEAHGADAAAALAQRFATIVREVVGAHDGQLIELRGDEALVNFALARRALRAALEIQARVAEELPQGVGIGLDAGEAIPVEGGYRGSALNLAARLCAQAGPGETLASEAVVHLAARVDGIGYADARIYRLKGIEEPVRAVHVVPASAASNKPIRYRTERRADRRMLAVGAALALVVVVAGGLVWLNVARPGASPTPDPALGLLAGEEPPLLAFVDPAAVTLTATTEARRPTDEATFADGSFWIADLDPPALLQVDPVTHEIVSTIGAPLPNGMQSTFDGGMLWVADGSGPRVVGVDVRTGVVTREFEFGADPEDTRGAAGVTSGAGSLWVSLPGFGDRDGDIVRLDPSSGQVQARIADLDFPQSLQFGDEAVWNVGGGALRRIDPATNRVTFTTELVPPDVSLPFLAIGGGSAWTANDEVGKVWSVDPSGRKTEYDVGFGARGLTPLGATMWVAVQDAGKLVGIDMTTGTKREIVVGHYVRGIASDDHQLMISVDSTPEERIAALDGTVLTIAAPFGPFEPSPDPPVLWSFEGRQTGYVTCAGLLRYPDEPSPGGWELVPEVAADMPEISDDGRTYTFRVRDGFSFSPPSNEAVTAETFRYSIERALSPALESQFTAQYLSDIEGAEEYMNGDAPTLAGVTASGDTLTITLVEPAPNFLHRLTMPYYCPVPIGTPAIAGGLDIIPPLSSTGPYYMTGHFGGELLVLAKNPNYHGDRPRPFDSIVWRTGITSPEVISRVESGLVDAGVAGAFDSTMNAQSSRATDWGPGSDNAESGDQRWFGAPKFGLDYLYLNPAGVFADPDMRRAVALAIDRERLASWFGEQPYAELLPPSVPGSSVGAAVPEPDLEAARALMAGRHETVVLGVFSPSPEWSSMGNDVASMLEPIGIDVEVREIEDLIAEVTDPATELDMYAAYTSTEYPDAVSLLDGLRTTAWIGPEAMAELDRVSGLSGTERIQRVEALARDISADAIAIPVAYPIYPMYLGANVGCGFVQPAIGAVDLLSLCPE